MLLVEGNSHIALICSCEKDSTSSVLQCLVVNFRIWNCSVFLSAAVLCLMLAFIYPEASIGFSTLKADCPDRFSWFSRACYE
jgi:hypothetical protein